MERYSDGRELKIFKRDARYNMGMKK